MATAVLLCLVVLIAGFVFLRAVGLAASPLALGLAAPAGLATLVVISSWGVFVGLPAPGGGILVLLTSLTGSVLAIAERDALMIATRKLWCDQRHACGVLAAALAVPTITLGVALAGAQVPLSPHDGAYHAQVIDGYRSGSHWLDWYPPGTAVLFGSVLQLMPWLDTAQGSLELGEALTLLGVLAVFGLGSAVWRNHLAGSLAALFLSLTYLFPYFPQFWSGWPLAMSLILVIGLWTVALSYVHGPNWGWAVLAGLLVGAIVLVHGTELYTAAILLVVTLLARWQRMKWSALARHLSLALPVAIVVAAPYLPILLHWAGGGGAYLAGIEDTQVPSSASSAVAGPSLYVVRFIEAMGIDLPLRVLLVAAGAIWAFRHRQGRSAVVIGFLFVAITSAFTFLSSWPVVTQAFAATFPWGQQYRVFMLLAIVQSLLAAAGTLSIVCLLASWPNRARRAAPLVGATWLVLATWAITFYVSIPAGLVVGYSADDAAAMAWLRTNAEPGTVANDGFADAGIWAPYKAGIEVLTPRALLDPASSADRALVNANLARLEESPAAAQAACRLRVHYVYHGARVSGWDERRFPTTQALRASRALQEVFRQGEAVVFLIQLSCLA
jgi:hypothetical protein